MITIGFCGMSHLGLCYSAAAAEKGFQVVCFDYSKNQIKKLKKFEIEVEEPELKKLIIKNKNNIVYTDKIVKLSSCDFVYFSYDVITDSSGKSDKSILIKNLNNLIINIQKKIPLIILSQVPPGFTKNYSKIKNNLYYQVETLIFGKAIFRALNPERFIIGSNNPNYDLSKKYKYFLNVFNCPIFTMRYESAELAKIAINCYLASNVSLTNTLAEISYAIGASWEEIVPTLKLDKRIGKYAYLKPGLGISGGNIERDLTSIKKIGKKEKSNIELINTIIDLSKYSKNWLYRNVNIHLRKNKYTKISILGLSYKENTNSIKNSASIELIKKIKNADIRVYDPSVKNIKIKNVIEYKTSNGAIKNSEILIIATPWDEFRDLDLKAISLLMNGKIIIDPYKIFNEDLVKKFGFDYYSIG
tara:strand:- start:28934 stop:30181 length:1248 start_codon:yes stop_codon:yes gene_type:complete